MAKLAISVLAFRDEQETDTLPLLARHGITGLETAPSRVTDAKAYRKHWQQEGITLCAMQSLLYGAPPCALFNGDTSREQMLNNLEAACALAQQLGIRNLVFGSSGQRRRGEIPYEEALTVAHAFFRHAALTAARYDTCLCIEAVPAEHGCDFIINTDEAAALVDAVNHPALALHFDVSTSTLAGENPARVIQRYASMMRHCHVSELQLHPLGTHGVDHASMAAALKSSDYSGWISLEMFAPDSIDTLEQSLHLFSKHYR